MQSINTNPFFYQSASDLDAEQIVHYYAEGGNITKALSSESNCYLVGERGAGKSMALLYHSFPVQKLLHHHKAHHERIGIYIPCNHPLMLKNEAALFEKYNALAVVEHFFCLSIAYHICSSLKNCCTFKDTDEQKSLLQTFSYALALEKSIPFSNDIFTSIATFITRECITAQRELNKVRHTNLAITYTFFSLILPLLDVIRRSDALDRAHFSLLFDDAHLLSEERKRILNSYISYRDHSAFSFKAAIASCEEYIFTTADGGNLIPGHDFSMINMEEDFQNSKSDFGIFLRNIIEKRLAESKINKTAEEYFPVSPSMRSGVEEGKAFARTEAIEKYGELETKKINDYIYKYGRARFFQTRQPKSGLPQYSGIETIAHVSTGVVRNALYPCWKMYEKESARLHTKPNSIPPHVQAETLKEESDSLWKNIRDGFENKIEGCTKHDSNLIKNFFTALGDLFRRRLLSRCSEPRILSFMISEQNNPAYEEVRHLVGLCRKAQLLYERFGPSKDDGRRETFYATNRLLWISRGLDPEGQHGRLSLRSSEILRAARTGSFETPSDDQSQNTLFEI